MTTDSTKDTYEHIAKVRHRMKEMIGRLQVRSAYHDASKMTAEEKPGYDIISDVLAGHAFGTDDYNAAMAEAIKRPEVETAIAHHYANNDHHPQYYQEGVAGMSLISLCEMLADWKVASERSGNILSIEFQINRFEIDPQLAAILRNTVAQMEW